jgi:hypothetical protein
MNSLILWLIGYPGYLGNWVPGLETGGSGVASIEFYGDQVSEELLPRHPGIQVPGKVWYLLMRF